MSASRRLTLKHFFRGIKSHFFLGQFAQRTPLGLHRFLALCLLTYLLAHCVRMDGKGSWREARERAS
ncbi:hypothetical protein [Limisphaera sp. 4302-co]|uniref:hypothetical protein n=1 Tax=Limisphaera sp. 4302-co TaxID=3400417 RepID=UPI003C27E888